MQKILESVFDLAYLVTVITLGARMIRMRGGRQLTLFGVMAVVLGAGDAFHLLPRVAAQWMPASAQLTAALGVGKLVTSVTMTVFYVLLYAIWRMRYGITGKRGLTAAVALLAAARVALCCFPQNAWTSADAPLSWGIFRNVPFTLLGLLLIVLFFRSARRSGDRPYRLMWLTITLSFAFYLPVVLFAGRVPAAGALMIPKTCAYVWTVLIGYFDMKERDKNEKNA